MQMVNSGYWTVGFYLTILLSYLARINYGSGDADFDFHVMSKVTGDLLNQLTILKQIEDEIPRFDLVDDPYFHLIETQVKPTQDKLKALQQTLLEASSKHSTPIRSEIKKKAIKLELVIESIQEKYNEIGPKLLEENEALIEKLKVVGPAIAIAFFKNGTHLRKIGIEFPDMTDTEDGPPAYVGNLKLKDVLPVIEELTSLFEEFEATTDELHETLDQLNIPRRFQLGHVRGTPAEDVAIEYLDIETSIEEFVTKHVKELTDTGPVVAGILRDLKSIALRNIADVDSHKTKCKMMIDALDQEMWTTSEMILEQQKQHTEL